MPPIILFVPRAFGGTLILSIVPPPPPSSLPQPSPPPPDTVISPFYDKDMRYIPMFAQEPSI